MVTAMIGAVANVLLNLWLIPMMGPMGAALATMVSYFLIFLIRLIHARRFIPFRTSPVWLSLSTGLLGGLCVVMTLAPRGWIWYSIGLCLLLALFTAPYLLRSMLSLFRQRRQKS